MRARACTIAGVLGLVLCVTPATARERVFYFHNDHLGTPQTLSDAAGRTVWQAEYEPFGRAAVNQDPDGDGSAVVNNLRFPGQYYDAETGLHYNYHRDYDPETGRYLTPDPLGLRPRETNLYSYARGNPVLLTDPSGLDTAGCDVIPDSWESDCALRCCAKHDECYANLGCSASSFGKGIFNPSGTFCNTKVEFCLARCVFDSDYDWQVPKYYCAKQKRYVRIPGDFPDYDTAKKVCDTR